MLTRIYVDFNTMTMDEQERVYIGRKDEGYGDQPLLQRLDQDCRVVLYDEEMEVDAVVELIRFREGYTAWMGRPDWSTRRDLTAVGRAPHFSAPVANQVDGGSDARSQ